MSGLDMCKEGLLTLQFEGVTTGQRFRAEGTFVHFMRGRFPQTVLTDLDPELRDAIRSELPGTKHVISIWDILPKISSWFSVSLGPRCMEFKSEFDELYRLESTEDFELQWNQTISMFGLTSDKHVALLYSFRESWAQSYIKGYFLLVWQRQHIQSL
ncbi:unnamed protein product [Malus baccata var. baccata]